MAFLDKRLNFGDIPAVIETVMHSFKGGDMADLSTVLAADAETVSPAAAIAPTTVRLASLPNFFVCMVPPLSGPDGPSQLAPGRAPADRPLCGT